MARGFSHDSQFYDNAPVAKQWKRSIFPILPDRASNFTSFNLGELVPLIKPIKVLPHDTFVFDIGSLVRMSNPLIAPLMDSLDFDVYAFYVPERLVFDKTKEFYGQNDSAGPRRTEILQPRIPITSFAYDGSAFISEADYKHTLAGHLGIPYCNNVSPMTTIGQNTFINILPIRGYFEIWNWYFRDQNIQDAFVISTGGSGDGILYSNNIIQPSSKTIGSMAVKCHGACSPLLKACKKHDFFTSMTLYAEKTLTPLTLPLGVSAPVKAGGTSHNLSSASVVVFNNAQDITSTATDLDIGSTTSTTTTLYADLSGATSASIKSLREILDLDHLLEIDEMAGTRYDEQIFAHFGARPLAESYKPQLLGEAHFKLNVDQVLAHAGSDTETLGETGAYSLTGNRSHLVSQSFSEPGYLYVLGVARQNVHIYSEGLDPMWSIQRRFDNYYPEFQDLGLMEYKKRTIKCTNTSSDDDTFGFAEYGQEYRVFTPMVSGDLDPNVEGSLNYWTLADELGQDVSLSPSFIEETKENLTRALSDKNMRQFIGRFGLKGTMTRVVALHSVPKGL